MANSLSKPVVVMASGGRPVVLTTGLGTPATVVTANGVGITLVSNLGVPMVLWNADGTAYSTAAVSLDFENGSYAWNGTSYGSDFSAFLAASSSNVDRESTGYADTVAGVWSSFSTDVARIVSGRGLYIESAAATNVLRNNSGTPGAGTPTNWSISGISGLTPTIGGRGTENGLPYVDFVFSGDGTGAQTISMGSTTEADAIATEVFTESLFLKLAAGSLTNLTLKVRMNERTSGGSLVNTKIGSAIVPTGTSARFSHTATLTGGTTAKIQPTLEWTAAGAVNCTLRIAGAQLEKAAAATSVILTTAAAVTRAAETLTVGLPAGSYTIRTTFENDSTSDDPATGTFVVPAGWISSVQG